MSERHVVVSASKGYEPGLRALVNSWARYHDVSAYTFHLLNLNLDPDAVAHAEEVAGANVVYLTQGNGESHQNVTKIGRFGYAATLDGIVMLLDADMFFLSSAEALFDIASAGRIVGGANGSIFGFTEAYQRKCAIPVPLGDHIETITSVPTVLDTARYGVIWSELHRLRTTGGATECDFILQNALIRHLGLTDRLWMIPCATATGVHEFDLKLNTRAISRHGRILTEDGLPIITSHGKWWNEKWRAGILKNMARYARGDERITTAAEQSAAVLYEEFQRARDGYPDDD